MSKKAAIVGLGETDFHKDYKAARTKDATHAPLTPDGLASTAFERALTDSGLQRTDIDGLMVAFLYGGPDAPTIANALGITPRFLVEGTSLESGGIMAGPLPAACEAIASGQCDTIAMIYAVASRSIGRKFGGQNFAAYGGAPQSYYYYHPWGWSSQAAHWALTWRQYQRSYGASDADLGSVAIQLRRNAMANPNAVMQHPLTIEEYLASRFVVRPLRLFDLCLVNDGAVCLIVRRADMACDLPHRPVHIAGWGHAKVRSDKLNALVNHRLRPQFQEASEQALAMAGVSLADIQHFEGYDASTIHLVNHLEGHGFVAEGTALEHFASGTFAVGGSLPVNTGGGILSGTYMHGWNHVAEITRQLRHEAGARQIADVEISMFSLAQTDRVDPVIFMRGE